MTWAAVLVGVLAAARLTRLVIADHWPPMVATVGWLTRRLPPAWADGLRCPYCVAPWAVAAVTAPTLVWGTPAWWWAAAGVLAASYPVAWIVRLDTGQGS